MTHSAKTLLWLAVAVAGTTVIAAVTPQHISDIPLEKVYADESHCLTSPDMRGDKDLRFSCWCRDALVDLRYVYSNYYDFSSPKHDMNMAGPVLQLGSRVDEACGEGAYNTVTLQQDRNWRWPGPEVVRTYPSEQVIGRITPEGPNGKRWRSVPFTVQLVFRDDGGKVTRTETYSRTEREPCVEGFTNPPCK